jgi:hypothetical protein
MEQILPKLTIRKQKKKSASKFPEIESAKKAWDAHQLRSPSMAFSPVRSPWLAAVSSLPAGNAAVGKSPAKKFQDALQDVMKSPGVNSSPRRPRR